MTIIDGRRYLKSVDKFNEWTVSAFITPASKRNHVEREVIVCADDNL